MEQPGLKPILILDDDAVFRDLVASILQAKGFSCVQARSPKEASAYLQGADPLMAIVDYRLPETDGLTWIGQLRDLGRNFPIVFVSAAWCDEKTFNWLRNILRVALILRKPIEPQLFWSQIEGLLPSSVLEQANDYQKAKSQFSASLTGELTDEDERLLAEQGEEALLAQLRQLKMRMEVQTKLNEARLAYMNDLKQAWQDLSKIVGDAQKDPGNGISLNEARMLAHKLRGTAGSLGFAEIGEAAGKVEDLLQALDPTDTLQEILWWEIIRNLAAGTTYIEEAAQTLDQQPPAPKESEPSAEMNILIVGNEPHYRAAIKELRSSVALAIEFAATVDDVPSRARRTAYDGIIIDLSAAALPEIFKLTSEIRALPGQTGVPFGFVLARGENQPTKVDLAYAGCSHLMPPGAGKDDLEACFSHMFRQRQAIKPRVLTVDDDEVLTKFIATILENEGIVVRQLNKPIQILETVEDYNPDLLLLDVIMPGLSGYDVCRMLRATDKWVQLPIVFLTSKNDQAGRAAAFQAGADDFLSKPVLAEELLARVKAQLEHAQTTKGGHDKDRLTGALTRRDFTLLTNSLIGEAKEKGLPLTVCLLSIDDFVNVSIDYSLFTAEEMVKVLGDLLHRHFKAEDLRGRFSDDSFVLALSGATQSEIGPAMERLLTEFRNLQFGNDIVGTFSGTFSAGLAQYPGDGESAELLIKAANSRLHSERRDKQGVIAFRR